MERINIQKRQASKAAIYARVSDKSQAEEDKTSITEQISEIEAFCERRGIAIVSRYREVGRGWSKNRQEFQRMLADARKGYFDTIVCWKLDRLSRGVYPAASLMEVIEAYRIKLEAVMDPTDMKTFVLMAAVGKIELDNFKERASLGRRGSAKAGRIPSSALPYGYRRAKDGGPELVENEAEIVRRIYDMYVRENMGFGAIIRRLTDEGVPSPRSGRAWHTSALGRILGNPTYMGVWNFGRTRHVLTELGNQVFHQPEDTWIQVPVPQLVDEDTWERVQSLKKKRKLYSKRNTKTFFLLQKAVRCAECGLRFWALASRTNQTTKNGKVYKYHYEPPRRYYRCVGMHKHRLRCRDRPSIRAESLEDLVWNEVKAMLQNPNLIALGIESLKANDSLAIEDEIAEVERELRKMEGEEDRLIRLYVSGKIKESQLDVQRKFITERQEGLQTKLADCRASLIAGSEQQEIIRAISAWTQDVGQKLDELSDEEKRDLLRLVLNETVVDGSNNVHHQFGNTSREFRVY